MLNNNSIISEAEQTKIYKKFHSIGKKLNESIQISELYDIAVDFTTQELNFEKCLIFEHDDKNGWFKIVKSVGYNNPMEQKILKIINLLLSGEVIEQLRIYNKAIIHSVDNPNKHVSSLVKSLFLSEAYFELFGGDINIPHSLIVAGNGLKNISEFSSVHNEIVHLALGNFTMQLSNTINNILFYKAWEDEKKLLEENIKKRTKQINEQKETFEAIYNTSKDGIAILDIETTAFLDVNPAYCDMTGYSKAELLRTSCMKLSVTDDKKRSAEAISSVLKNGFIQDFIKTCIAKDGRKVIVNMSISLMSDRKQMLVSAKDITTQQEIEKEVQKSHKNIRDSIEYAALIQQAILPSCSLKEKYFNDSFIFWQPRDTVGGDIYFILELDSKEEILIMVIDGAGHGVPGAFVTMLVKAIESQIIAEIRAGTLQPSPALILSYFNKSIKTMLKQEKGSRSNAGFDGGVLYYNKATNECKYAGAKIDLYVIDDNKLQTIQSDRKHVGFARTKINQEYTEHSVNVKEGTKLYIATDGFYDQDGLNNKRYGKSEFKRLILKLSNNSFQSQKNDIIQVFENFKDTLEQSDDVTVVGLQF